ncbi:MAG: hypothetical protein LBR10_10020 [Prevotellaceae bacterium]|jgi:hypothetical protein|nr:hypothetical protein [Prevotellaceae bacterium]
MDKKIVPHTRFTYFQEKYGAIPASDINNDHIIKSRMLQGIYRNQKIENEYCNIVRENGSFINFMRNNQLKEEAEKELEAIKQRERLTDEDRLFTNLLSSQPMAFNIFLPLKWNNYEVGTSVFKEIFPFLNIRQLTDIKLEYVPGDGNGKKDRKITTDNSCFDVYIEYRDNNGQKGSIGIEVKYTEPFSQSDYWNITGHKKDRYIEAIKKYSAQFSIENAKEYLLPANNQLFRNQLLAEEVKDKFGHNCIVVVVYSAEDKKCYDAIMQFRKLIKSENSFVPVTIDRIVSKAIEYAEKFPDVKLLYENIYNRYCNYKLLNEVIPNKKSEEIVPRYIRNKDMIIDTLKGSIEILDPKVKMLGEISGLMPFGFAQFGEPQNGAKYGLVMQCGEEEVYCLKQQPVELEQKNAEQMLQIQYLMIVEAYCTFIQHGFSGMYLACPYLRQRDNKLWEAGIANFIFPSHSGKETETEGVFDNRFGRGATTMLTNFISDLRASFQKANITMPSYFGLDERAYSHLQFLAMNFMVLGSDIFCVQTNLQEKESAWSILASNGIKNVYHLPSVPLTIPEKNLCSSKGKGKPAT